MKIYSEITKEIYDDVAACEAAEAKFAEKQKRTLKCRKQQNICGMLCLRAFIALTTHKMILWNNLKTMSIKSSPLWNKSTFNMKTKSPKQCITKRLRKRNGKSKKTSRKAVGGNNLCPKIIKIIK